MEPTEKMVSIHVKIQAVITSQHIILNNYTGPFSDFINIHILIVKFYVFRSKVQGTPLSFKECIQEITKIRRIEKFIAKKLNKSIKHDIKWLED